MRLLWFAAGWAFANIVNRPGDPLAWSAFAAVWVIGFLILREEPAR